MSELDDILPPWKEHLDAEMAGWKAARGIHVGAGSPPSSGMCAAAAWATAQFLAERTGRTWTIAGGWSRLPEQAAWRATVREREVPGGLRDTSGAWQGHYWAVSEADPDDPEAPSVVVDLAADQFGWPGIVVTDDRDPRYRPNVWDDLVEDQPSVAEKALACAWVASHRAVLGMDERLGPGMAPSR